MMLSVKQVAELFNVSEFKIYRWAKTGKIPSYSIGRIIRFDMKKYCNTYVKERVRNDVHSRTGE
ncbi:helix-turn-helix domain-containing protein [Oceanobacillus sp. 143]|uniref:Helix-turn-helix domain-containing protein n=1 Tax=Oceanobacillus zhaokaii TaxID=2052660 RepID=A0A345PGP6_9BACI|nr:hypothetical protein CUC15_09660 [Oceanobacillus zhaokaii]QGS68710.1 helix-turn-helix domain-containing protein [Oceanobacillus sp. 143]